MHPRYAPLSPRPVSDIRQGLAPPWSSSCSCSRAHSGSLWISCLTGNPGRPLRSWGDGRLASWAPTVVSIFGIFPDLLWQDDLLLHLPTPASVSPVAQPPRTSSKALFPPPNTSWPQSWPEPAQAAALYCGVASWQKVNIPQAEQRTWQGPGTSLQQPRWCPLGVGGLLLPDLVSDFRVKGTPGPGKEGWREGVLLSRLSRPKPQELSRAPRLLLEILTPHFCLTLAVLLTGAQEVGHRSPNSDRTLGPCQG